MIRLSALCILLFFGPSILAQKNVFLKINPVFNEAPLQLDVELLHNSGESYSLDHFDYYISDILITHDGGQVSSALETIYLLEPNSYSLYLGALALENIEKIEFTVGVPDRMNTQQGIESEDISSYPETHPLSFQIPSMYWGWSFGYMPMIIGGTSEGGLGFFELHSVGPNLQRQVVLPVIQTDVSTSQVNIELQCHVNRWVNGIELAGVGILHGAAEPNVLAMDNVTTENVFTLSPTANMFYTTEAQPHIFVFDGQLNYFDLPHSTTEIGLYDQLGRQLISSKVTTSKGFINLNSNQSGTFFVFCRDTFGSVIEKQTIFIP